MDDDIFKAFLGKVSVPPPANNQSNNAQQNPPQNTNNNNAAGSNPFNNPQDAQQQPGLGGQGAFGGMGGMGGMGAFGGMSGMGGMGAFGGLPGMGGSSIGSSGLDTAQLNTMTNSQLFWQSVQRSQHLVDTGALDPLTFEQNYTRIHAEALLTPDRGRGTLLAWLRNDMKD